MLNILRDKVSRVTILRSKKIKFSRIVSKMKSKDLGKKEGVKSDEIYIKMGGNVCIGGLYFPSFLIISWLVF